ncbi:hypothetical protein CsSME_00004577 [Camellia sinensis var. sinensis]
MYPSFATSILDEICRSMDGGNENFYNNRVVKNTCTSHLPSFASGILDEICLSMDSENEKQGRSHSVMDEDMASLRRVCLPQHETTSVSKRPKPVKTTSVSKKEKQPILAGCKLASFLKSLFSNGNSKKAKNSSSSSTGGYGDAHVPLYVATKMASIRRSSFLVPSIDSYAGAALRWIGYEPRCTPYWPHSLLWGLAYSLPESIVDAWSLRFCLAIRKKGQLKDNRKVE